MDTLEWVKGLFEKKLRIPIIILIGFMVYFAGNKLGVGKLTNGSPGKLVLQGHNRLTKEEILQILHIDSSTTVEDIDTNEMEVRLKRHPRILSAKVGVRSKDQILVQIEEKKASMVINMNDTLYEVDSGLNILSVDDVRDNELFLISGDFKIQEGKIVSPLLMDVIQSMDSAFSQYPNLKERISEVKLQKGRKSCFVSSIRND